MKIINLILLVGLCNALVSKKLARFVLRLSSDSGMFKSACLSIGKTSDLSCIAEATKVLEGRRGTSKVIIHSTLLLMVTESSIVSTTKLSTPKAPTLVVNVKNVDERVEFSLEFHVLLPLGVCMSVISLCLSIICCVRKRVRSYSVPANDQDLAIQMTRYA